MLVPVAVVAVLVSLLLPAGRHQWALSLIRQPTPYTSLFFTKPAALPAAVSWDAPVPVSFSIQNNQGRPTAYRYVITDSAANQTQQLAEAKRTVRSGATWTVSIVLHPDCAATPCRFDIALPGHPETIDFQVSMK